MTMNMHVSPNAPALASAVKTLDPATVLEAARIAGRRIAPLWPLRNFMAVNPFLGLADQSAASSARILGGAMGARLTRPLSFFAAAIASGRLTDDDLAAALSDYPEHGALPGSVAAFKSRIMSGTETEVPLLPTLADTATILTAADWSAFVTDRISHWASHRFDTGQSLWRPAQPQSLFASWRQEALTDMRAQLNPTRMREIGALASRFAQRLATCCPACGVPGFGTLRSESGLPCSECDTPTTLVLHGIDGCAACAHETTGPRSDGRTHATPAECPECNP